MAAPSLEGLKRHLRIRTSAEDADLELKLEAAQAHAAGFMGRPLEPWTDAGTEPPADVELAIYMLAAEFYANREGSVVGTIYSKVPHAENILHLHRKGLGV
jgi:uncharacterized phage protein (predicted DNA packaging)